MGEDLHLTTAGLGAEETALSGLRAASDEWTRRLTAATNRAVAVARSQGASWAEVGRELGMTRQGARQRFGWIEAGGVRLLRHGGRAWLEYEALPDEPLDPRRDSRKVAWQAVRELA
jgi:hypothetical protein